MLQNEGMHEGLDRKRHLIAGGLIVMANLGFTPNPITTAMP